LLSVHWHKQQVYEAAMKQWQYIHDELRKRKINLISIGADGDSRELQAMQLSTELLFTNQGSKNQGSALSLGSVITIPPTWKTWFALKPTDIAYVQDIMLW